MNPALPAAERSALAERIMARLRTHLRTALEHLLDAVEDDLGSASDQAADLERRISSLDNVRALRRHRSQCIVAYLNDIERQFKVGGVDAARQPLSLVAHDQLSVELEVTAVAARAAQRLGLRMHEINATIGALLGRAEMDDHSNPIAPYRLTRALATALAPVEIDLDNRLTLIGRFEHAVLDGLHPIYQELLATLAAAGLGVAEPEFAPPPPAERPPDRGTGTAAPERAAETAQDAGPERRSTPPTPHDARADVDPGWAEVPEYSQFMALLDRLERRMRSSPSAAMADPPARSAAALDAVLLRALERLGGGQPTPPPRQLAAQLLAEARYADQGAVATPSHAATVDLVGRVFERLLELQQLPKATHPLFQPLQVPMTRAALRDPTALAAETRHPLRQALDLIAQTTRGWCPSADPGGAALRQLQDLVDAIVHARQPERQEAGVQALRRCIEAHNRRAEVVEQRAVEATSTQERLHAARRRVFHLTSSRLARNPVPAWVSHLISRPWANYMVLLLLRHGEASAQFRESVGFADLMIWASAAGQAQVERLRLHALVPVLEAQLRTGLSAVAYHPPEVDQLCSELRAFMRWRLGEAPRPACVDRTPEIACEADHFLPQAPVVEDQPSIDEVDPSLMFRIRNLAPGTWFEFAHPGREESDRAKLSWISPSSGRCLFVNRNGMRVGERPPEELVSMLQRGLARIYEDANLMQQVLSDLERQIGSTRDTPAQQG